MKFVFLAATIVALTMTAAGAKADDLAPSLKGVDFLLGDWTGAGKAEHDTTARGTSSIHPIVGGKALLRQDHDDVRDKTGKIVESFDQVMTIYPENGTLRADYLDGTHTIHYASATVEAGQSVQFLTSSSNKDAPAFRLTYRKASDGALAIKFETAPQGSSDFHTVAEGTVVRK